MDYCSLVSTAFLFIVRNEMTVFSWFQSNTIQVNNPPVSYQIPGQVLLVNNRNHLCIFIAFWLSTTSSPFQGHPPVHCPVCWAGDWLSTIPLRTIAAQWKSPGRPVSNSPSILKLFQQIMQKIKSQWNLCNVPPIFTYITSYKSPKPLKALQESNWKMLRHLCFHTPREV